MIMPANENTGKIPNNTTISREIFSTHIERLKSFRHSFSNTEKASLSPTLYVQYVVLFSFVSFKIV